MDAYCLSFPNPIPLFPLPLSSSSHPSAQVATILNLVFILPIMFLHFYSVFMYLWETFVLFYMFSNPFPSWNPVNDWVGLVIAHPPVKLLPLPHFWLLVLRCPFTFIIIGHLTARWEIWGWVTGARIERPKRRNRESLRAISRTGTLHLENCGGEVQGLSLEGHQWHSLGSLLWYRCGAAHDPGASKAN